MAEESSVKKETVYATGFPFVREEGNLVVFGSKQPEFHYDDGSEVESWLSFNKSLWETMGKPEEICAAISKTDDFLRPIDTVWVVKYSNYEPAEVDSIHLTEETAKKRADELNTGKDRGWEVASWKIFVEGGKDDGKD